MTTAITTKPRIQYIEAIRDLALWSKYLSLITAHRPITIGDLPGTVAFTPSAAFTQPVPHMKPQTTSTPPVAPEPLPPIMPNPEPAPPKPATTGARAHCQVPLTERSSSEF